MVVSWWFHGVSWWFHGVSCETTMIPQVVLFWWNHQNCIGECWAHSPIKCAVCKKRGTTCPCVKKQAKQADAQYPAPHCDVCHEGLPKFTSPKGHHFDRIVNRPSLRFQHQDSFAAFVGSSLGADLADGW